MHSHTVSNSPYSYLRGHCLLLSIDANSHVEAIISSPRYISHVLLSLCIQSTEHSPFSPDSTSHLCPIIAITLPVSLSSHCDYRKPRPPSISPCIASAILILSVNSQTQTRHGRCDEKRERKRVEELRWETVVNVLMDITSGI